GGRARRAGPSAPVISSDGGGVDAARGAPARAAAGARHDRRGLGRPPHAPPAARRRPDRPPPRGGRGAPNRSAHLRTPTPPPPPLFPYTTLFRAAAGARDALAQARP